MGTIYRSVMLVLSEKNWSGYAFNESKTLEKNFHQNFE